MHSNIHISLLGRGGEGRGKEKCVVKMKGKDILGNSQSYHNLLDNSSKNIHHSKKQFISIADFPFMSHSSKLRSLGCRGNEKTEARAQGQSLVAAL